MNVLVLSAILLAAYTEGRGLPVVPLFSDGRIINGTIIDISEAPYQINLMRRLETGTTYYHTCGGSVLSAKYVITAAHCIWHVAAGGVINDFREQPFVFLVDAGSSVNVNIQNVEGNVASITVHPLYDPINNLATTDYDVAILKISPKLHVSSCNDILPVKLPPSGYSLPSGTNLYVTGWGKIEPSGTSVPDLRGASVELVADTECTAIYGYYFVSSRMLCTFEEGRETGQGDSGGPLVYKDRDEVLLIGIVSAGNTGRPHIITNVADEEISEFVRKEIGLLVD